MKKFGSDVMALPINPLRRKKPLPSATMGKMREREVEIPGAPFGKLSPRANIENENKKDESTSEDDELITIKSPIIGTFYRKSAPDKPPFVEVGDTIKEGDVLCVIEAMKLFNEIESELGGTIVKILIDDASPVEFDQPLFLIKPL